MAKKKRRPSGRITSKNRAEFCDGLRRVTTPQEVRQAKDLLNKPIGIDPSELNRAMKLVAQGPDDDEVIRTLGTVMTDERIPLSSRTLAAARLGFIRSTASEDALLKGLKGAPEPVLLEAFQSLGKIGTRKSLRKLQSMTHPREPLQRRHWNFARHLIGLREGETPVRGARSSLGTKWIHQSTRTLSGARLRKVLDRLSGDTYGVAFHEYKALHWRYDETSHVILWNRVVAEGDSASLLCERPWIAGAVFREEKEIERFAIRFLILTSPRGKNVDVLITRTSGVCLYEGSTVRGEEGLRASLREVGPERTPTLVEAFVSNGNIRVDFRLGLESIRPKRRPLRILSDTMEMNG